MPNSKLELQRTDCAQERYTSMVKKLQRQWSDAVEKCSEYVSGGGEVDESFREGIDLKPSKRTTADGLSSWLLPTEVSWWSSQCI